MKSLLLVVGLLGVTHLDASQAPRNRTQLECCGMTFSRSYQYVCHAWNEHGIKIKGVERCICTYPACARYAYANPTVHARVHTGEKPHVCTLCDRRFADYSTLKNHKRLHTGEKPYSCDACGRRFTQVSQLTYHVNRHTCRVDAPAHQEQQSALPGLVASVMQAVPSVLVEHQVVPVRVLGMVQDSQYGLALLVVAATQHGTQQQNSPVYTGMLFPHSTDQQPS